MKGLGRWLSLVKFGHSIFALPFALTSAWIAADGPPRAATLGWIVVCAVAARTAAMAFNRWLDRDVDAANPRTANRELPRGVVSPRAVLVLVGVSASVFVAAAYRLNPLAGRLAWPVMGLLLGYSAVKRFHWGSHLVLGLALGAAPLGAWVAVRGNLDGDLAPPILLALAVTTWVFGFDLIYAAQDAEFDRRAGLHSIPARFGVARALRLSGVLHLATVILLVGLAWRVELSGPFLGAVAFAAGLLVWQHRLVSPDDLSRADTAFFTLNGWVAVAMFLGTALEFARSGVRP